MMAEMMTNDDTTGTLTEWCAEKAAEALRYLAVNCPASSGSPELHPHQDEAHAAAVEGDGPQFIDALRGYVRCGQDLQRRAGRSRGAA